jgi:membrane protein
MGGATDLGRLKHPRSWSDRRPWRVIVDVAGEFRRNDLMGLSAEIAFYGIFSLFPLVIVIRSLEPYLPEGQQLIPAILTMIEEISAGDDSRIYEIVNEQLLQPSDSRRAGLLSFSLITSLWGASRGFGILVKGVNLAYDVRERRGWLQRRLMGLAITVTLLVLLVGGIIVGVFGPQILAGLLARVGISEAPEFLLRAARWPVALLLLGAGLTVLYYLAPQSHPRWRWTPAGSVFAVVSLLLLSFLLSVLLQQDFFEIEWLTYSAFGLMLVILLWMFLASLVVLIGAEINAVLDRRFGGDGLPDRDEEDDHMRNQERGAGAGREGGRREGGQEPDGDGRSAGSAEDEERPAARSIRRT